VANKDNEKAKKEAEKLAREQAKKEAEEAKIAKKEAERLAREEAKARKEAEKLAREQAKKEAEKLAKQDAKEAKQETAPEVSTAAYEGKYQLVLPSSVGFKQVKLFAERLALIDDLQVVWTGGSMDEGTLITVSVAKAMPLAQIIGGMPMVGGVEVKGDKITINLEASA
jgi:hypothetical protein